MDPELLTKIIFYALFFVAIIASLTIHEFAHAWTALKFGDTTARDAGRVSFNPMVHLDPMGLLCMLLMGFGWAKPTPVNINRLNHPRADLVVSAAGPLSNFILASIVAGGLRFSPLVDLMNVLGVLTGAQLLGVMLVQLNVMLGFFNFLPIGPLDGSHVIRNLLPFAAGVQFDRFNHAYGSLLLLGLILFGRMGQFDPLSMILGLPVSTVTAWLLGSSMG